MGFVSEKEIVQKGCMEMMIQDFAKNAILRVELALGHFRQTV
jgi:hypothetical protein